MSERLGREAADGAGPSTRAIDGPPAGLPREVACGAEFWWRAVTPPAETCLPPLEPSTFRGAADSAAREAAAVRLRISENETRRPPPEVGLDPAEAVG